MSHPMRRVKQSARSRFRRPRRGRRQDIFGAGTILQPELLEPRHLLAAVPVGKDTNDEYMKAREPGNPQWNMEKTMTDVAWTLYTGQPTNVIAVMDYGIDYLHQDFGSSLGGGKGQLWDRALFGNDPNIYASKRGKDEINNVDGSRPGNEGATKPAAGELWGNHAAGIIGAMTNNQIGVAGMNWSIQLLSSKVLQGPDPYDVAGFNLLVLQQAVDHIRYLRDVTPNNPQLIRSVAFGYSTKPGIDYGDPFPIWAQLGQQGAPNIADATKGILVTVPSGDFGTDVWSPLPQYYFAGRWDPNPNPPDVGNYAAPGSKYNPAPGEDGYGPGRFDNIIVVGATNPDDTRWNMTSNVPRIDIYAPGTSIISVGDAAVGSKYVVLNGTRQAAAHVSGAIGLIYDAGARQGKTLTYQEVRRALIEGGDNIGLNAPRLNLLGAMRYLGLDTKPDPNARTLSIAGGSRAEGDSGQSQATFTLSVDRALTVPLAIQVRIDDGTATADNLDYARPSNGLVSVTIPAGRTNQTFTVPVFGDRAIESNETFSATIVSAPATLTVATGTATWTITNDDALPTIQFGSNISVLEGSGGVIAGRIRVWLSKSVPYVVTGTVTLQAGTATAGADFVNLGSQQVIFLPNTVEQLLTVQVLGDTVMEGNETFSATLLNAQGATLGTKSSVLVTITDDDAPLVSLLSAPVRALAGTGTTLTFTVSLSTAAKAPVSISFRGLNGTAISGNAGAGDYLLAAGTLSFAVGEKVKTISVTIQPRRPAQAYPKRFTLELSSAVNARLAGGLATQSAQGVIF